MEKGIKSIKFINFKYINSRVDFLVIINDTKEYNIFFEINQAYNFQENQDALALACSTLCGKEYEQIMMDLVVSKKVYDDIVAFTNAEVIFKSCNDNLDFNDNIEESWLLNFSGGIDSLAAYYLMPKETKLVAVDFGKNFEREKKWFEKFNPVCIKTNFREEKLDRASWTFMGVGSIFAQSIYHSKYIVFGTILEASPYQFYVGGGNYAVCKKTLPFSSGGLEDVRITNGLTEIGTMMIVGHYNPKIINEALNSLAQPGSEKKYRKHCLAKIVFDKFSYDFHSDQVETPKTKVKFGTNMALDFLALYVIKNLGIEEAKKTISNIPKDYCDMAKELSLNFYERFNTNYLERVPLNYRNEYLARLLNAGILPYNEQDWNEYRCVVDYLFAYTNSINNVKVSEDNSIKVSVIIPIYNVEKYLETCLKSVINQSLKEIEIICVNDGTTDNSMSIVEKYAVRDNRVKIINKQNGGLSSARNRGLLEATGNYVLFLDSDDWIEQETLEELYKIASENNLDNIYFNAEVFYESDKIKGEESGYLNYYDRNGTYNGVYNGRKFCQEIMKNGDFRPSACLQMPKRKLLLDNHIYFYEGIIHEDNLFTIQSMLIEKRVMFINKAFYQRRIRQNSIVTAEKGVNNAIGYFIFSREIAKFLEGLELDNNLYFEIENYVSWTMEKAIKYIECFDRKQVIKSLSKYSNDIKLSFMLYIYRESVTRRRLNKVIEDYKNCTSYRLGRIITYLPRMAVKSINFLFRKDTRK